MPWPAGDARTLYGRLQSATLRLTQSFIEPFEVIRAYNGLLEGLARVAASGRVGGTNAALRFGRARRPPKSF
jgi:hypothetical protein